MFKKLCFVIFFFIHSLFVFAGGSPLDFRNAELISGTAGTDGAVYRFPNIGKKTDALVTIKRRSDPLVYLVNIDMKTSGFDKAWQPQVGYNKSQARNV